ncbi:MAG TPA: BadF/BadG/BcrA/BcrD ATPase family protein [Fimbriimonadaceae bacterium]|nr:BadF/BadG/BcrA/BcrD ATPase family protein [Fimbriimonadaceae bacterium]
MPIFVGLDCGGSSCRALAVDDAGNQVHIGQSGPANLASTPPKRLETNVLKTLDGCPSPDFVAGCFAGLLTEDDRRRALELLSWAAPRAKVIAEPDYVAAYLACDEDTDICLIAGTGSLICSRYEGKVVKSGGGGYLLGDFGSACQYGRAVLSQFLVVGESGMTEPTRSLIEKQFGSTQENEVLAGLYRGGAPAARLAKLAPAISRDANAGEPYALLALREQTAHLASILRSHADRYHKGATELRICLAGGLWEASPIFQSQLEMAVNAALAGYGPTLTRLARPPVQGAVRLAQQLAQ